MTLNVHETHVEEYLNEERGYVEVGRVHYEHDGQTFDRVNLAHPDTTCLKPMRGWTVAGYVSPVTGERKSPAKTHHGFCLLDAGHKGRHSTVVFYCDGCGKTRRGEPYRSDHEQDVAFCFMCCEVDGNGRWY